MTALANFTARLVVAVFWDVIDPIATWVDTRYANALNDPTED